MKIKGLHELFNKKKKIIFPRSWDTETIIPKKYSSDYLFLNINNDALSYENSNINLFDADPLLYMTIMYIRRTAISALFLQNIATYEDYNYTSNMFSMTQLALCGAAEDLLRDIDASINDPNCVHFQNEAAALASEIMGSYNICFLNLKIVSIICQTAKILAEESENEETYNEYISDQDLLYKISILLRNEDK